MAEDTGASGRRETTRTVLQLLPALGDGGVEKSAVEMARFTTGKGWKSLVVSRGGDLVGAVEAGGARHLTMPVGAKMPWAILTNARRLGALIDREDVDLVHARSRAPAWAGWLAVQYFSRRKPAFLTTFHGTYGHKGALKRAYNAVMLKGPWVIANSGFIRDHIVEVYGYPRDRIVVAERGVDETTFDPGRIGAEECAAIRAELAVPEGVPLLLMVGRLTRWKGHHVLIEALAGIQTPFVCAFAGDGGKDGYRAELERTVAEKSLGERIRFLGSRRDIPNLNAAADIAFSCSTDPEAFGRVAIEAMAMATPIIASAHGGSLETVVDGETGLLVPPGDADALREAIRSLIDDPQRRQRIGEAGRRRVLAEFTTRATCEKEFSAYEAVLRDG
ncbi:Spore coat protein SA [Hartmannibacter diazotrophicus]|uniref:Spore coat protein SA n=1 Tax=Hartmannibacter diazotrophicus TaxID=1482074 RepID=A0A2C9D9L8_9HYPH|nr:glycosyltransferase family 4 protein [Hartmannibacter diazotrophicus]SON56987.1 Spore coat protein SA [Hartmannibacter diazotrophicus]